MNNYHSIINTFDIYGYRPHLFIGNYPRSGSFIGLLLTINSLIFMIVISFYFIFQLFDTKKVFVTHTIKGINNNSKLEVSKNTFYFSIELKDLYSYNTIMNEKIFYLKAYYRLAIRNNENMLNWTIKELNISKCSLNDFHTNYKNLFLNRPLTQRYCIKNLNESIFENYQNHSFIFIELYQCKNTTKNKNCLPKEKIDNYLNGTLITIAYQEIGFDPINYKNPNQPLISEYYTSISNKYFKEIHLYFKEVEISTNQGILFDRKKSKKFTQFADVRDMISFKKNPEKFAEISIKTYRKSDYYLRSYVNLETVVADIGGFVKFISMIFYFLHYIFLQGGINQRIINKLFFIKNDKYSMNKVNSISIINKNCSNHIFNKNSIQGLFLNDSSTIAFQKTKYKKTNSNINNNDSNKNQNLYINDYNNNPNLNIKINENKSFNNKKAIFSSIIDKQINSNIGLNNNILSRNRFFKIRNKKFKRLKLSYLDKLFFICKYHHPNENIKYYLKGLNMIRSKLDMINIVSESFKNDLLKSLFLNENQVKILERLYKPELLETEINYDLTNIEYSSEFLDKEGLESYIFIKTNSVLIPDEERKNKTKIYDKFFIDLIEKYFSI